MMKIYDYFATLLEMSIKEQIDADLKQAMLSGDKTLVTTLRGLKSSILYAEVAKGNRAEGLSDDDVVELFIKEAKKRQESADLYTQGGSEEKTRAELTEKSVIEKYLPAQMTDEELNLIVDGAIQETGATGIQQMGQVIGLVRQKVSGQADGARIAAAVKGRLS